MTLLTSHYMQDIEELCHRVLVIDHGKIFFDGPLDEIIDRFSVTKFSASLSTNRYAGFFAVRRSDRANADVGATQRCPARK